MCVGDYDNDGFEDVYVTAFGPNVLWRNNGNGTFTDVTRRAGVETRDGAPAARSATTTATATSTCTSPTTWSSTSARIPARGRPRLPLHDHRRRSAARGGWRAKPTCCIATTATAPSPTSRTAAGITDPGYYGFGVLFTDLDDDGWPDIYVANDSMPNLFFSNRGNGTFVEEGLLSGRRA